jgi:hypothetical protein
VQVALNLPPGVSAVPAGGGGGAVGAAAFRQDSANAASQNAPLAINCPGGTGTVTCKTGSGLQPGQSAVLTFRLQADQSAQGGTVTGSVTAGTAIKVSVSVKVTVKTPPDALLLRANTDVLSEFPWLRNPRVYVHVLNTGETTKPVTVTFDHPLYQSSSFRGFPCDSTESGATCTTHGSLAPGQQVDLWVQLDGRPAHDSPVTVSAALGTAMAKPVQLSFGCWLGICDLPYPTTGSPAPPERPSSPTTSPSTSTSPSKPKKHPSTSVTPPSPPAEQPATTTSSTPSTSTSAPPDPGPGNSGKPGQTPPTIEPRGFFDWLRG